MEGVPEDVAALAAVIAAEQRIRVAQAALLESIARFAHVRAGDEFAADELAVALNITRVAAIRQVELAVAATGRLGTTTMLLGEGAVDLRTVQVLAEVTDPVPPEIATQVESYVLERAAGRNASEIRRIATRAVARFDPDGAAARHRERKRDRRVEIWPCPEGMAELRAYLDAADATRIKLRLDAFAKAAAPGDERTMDQRRLDALTDLLLCRSAGPVNTVVHVTVPANVLADASPQAAAAHAPADGEPVVPVIPIPSSRLDSPLAPYHVAAGATYSTDVSCLDPEPHLRTPLTPTPRGRSEATGWWVAGPQSAELGGYGTITAAQARELAAADAVWKRLITDPRSGELLDHGRTAYRPPAALAEFVRARDQHCVFPGCNRAAAGCDLDHRVPYPKGSTSPGNLAALCRHHHRLKHETRWRVDKRADGTYVWTSPTEIDYLNRPEPVVEADPHPELNTEPDDRPPPF